VLDALGLSPGRLTLDVKGRVFAPGDFIRGRVTLHLREEFEARQVSVSLEAKQRAVGLAPGRRGLALSYQKNTVWRFELQLDGERVYRDGLSWTFELLVPEGALEPAFGQGLLDAITATHRFPLEWSVTALLDRPWKLNLKASIDVQVASRPKPPAKAKRPRAKKREKPKKREP
jgi:hypothetical protein